MLPLVVDAEPDEDDHIALATVNGVVDDNVSREAAELGVSRIAAEIGSLAARVGTRAPSRRQSRHGISSAEQGRVRLLLSIFFIYFFLMLG